MWWQSVRGFSSRPRVHQLAAVNVDRLARYERCFPEECRRFCDVLGSPEPVDRDAFELCLAVFLRATREHVRLDIAGCDGVDSYFGGEVLGVTLCESHEARL
jgi:hypothetical protein